MSESTIKPPRRKMTAEEATMFETFSAVNAAVLDEAARERGCACTAYTDWYTYNRWQAQGMQVQRGQHGARLRVYIPIYRDDPQSGERVKAGERPAVAVVFCRHQVLPKNGH